MNRTKAEELDISRRKIKDLQGLMKRAAKKGVEPIQLSYHEILPFFTEHVPLRRNCFHMNLKKPCVICEKTTGIVDRFHDEYVCSDSCLATLDARFLSDGGTDL